MKSILVITGAGASHDFRVKQDGGEERPPLTKDLFNGGYSIEWQKNFLTRNHIASQVGYNFDNQPEVGRKQLEKYLFDLKNNPNPDVHCQYWAVPIYLQELFLAISTKYHSTGLGLPSNYKKLVEQISEFGGYDQVLWLNLNYDLLADYAIRIATDNDMNDLSDYMKLTTKRGLQIKYTKPHGSVDWFLPTENIGVSVGSAISGKVTTSLAAKLPKTVITVRDKKYFYTIESIMCIGFSALDQDILKLIKEIPNIKEKLQNKTIVVNGKEEDSLGAYNLLLKANCGIAGARGFFAGGFSDFVNGPIERWLQAP